MFLQKDSFDDEPDSSYVFDELKPVDHRDLGSTIFDEIYDQKQCKASWAFAYTASIDGNEVLELLRNKGNTDWNKYGPSSPQQLIDCVGLDSCAKGSNARAIHAYMKVYAIYSEKDYPMSDQLDNMCIADQDYSERTIKSDFITIENFPGQTYAEKFKRMVSVGVVYTVIVGNKDL